MDRLPTTKRPRIDERNCRICGEYVAYPTGLYLRGGMQVHATCAQRNHEGIGVRIPKADPR